MTRGPEAWTLPPAVRRAVLAHARECGPRECCGVLIGMRREVAFAVRMRNVAADPRRRFRFDEMEHIALRRWLRRARPALRIIGVYHSHPAAAARPSATDVREAHYPAWLYLIAGRAGARHVVKGFRISGAAWRAVTLRTARPAARPAR